MRPTVAVVEAWWGLVEVGVGGNCYTAAAFRDSESSGRKPERAEPV